jgi:cell division protein FtsL
MNKINIYLICIIIIIIILLFLQYKQIKFINIEENFANKNKKINKQYKYNWGIYPQISGYTFNPNIINGILFNEIIEYPAKPSMNCV